MDMEKKHNQQICKRVGNPTKIEKRGKTMDHRVEKTKHSIFNAFIELRSHKPLERITVKELCELAKINKSTFYSHYVDIYDLSEQIESEITSNVIKSIDNIEEAFNDLVSFSKQLFLAYTAQDTLISIIFSGSRKEQLPRKILCAMKEQFFERFPEYANNCEKNITLTYTVYGGYYAFVENRSYGDDVLIQTFGNISNKIALV